MTAAAVLLASLPVLAFLAGLRLMDSWKLVPLRRVARALLAGAALALLAWGGNGLLLSAAGIEEGVVRRWLAPLLEETLKAAAAWWLVRRGLAGFLVDAAIYGFAIGAGFALAENLYFGVAAGPGSLLMWTARGFGTAILHGAATAIAAILGRHLTARHDSTAPLWFVPGLLLAVLLHAAYNHVLVNPLLAAALLLLAVPATLVLVFERSERATRAWLGSGFDGDVERLEQLLNGPVAETPVGRYLDTLRDRFEGPVLADMLCLLRLHLELALKAKGRMIARAAGVDLAAGPEVRADFAELRHLERAIGPTGRLALQPLLQTSRRDLWQLAALED